MSSGNASRCPVALQDQLEAQGERAHLILTGAGGGIGCAGTLGPSGDDFSGDTGGPTATRQSLKVKKLVSTVYRTFVCM